MLEIPLFIQKWKIFVGSLAVAGLTLADGGTERGSMEDYTLKGCLVIAVLFLVRQLLKEREEYTAGRERERKEHAVQMQEMSARHRGLCELREAKLHEICDGVGSHLDANTKATDRQTEWFDGLGKELISRGLDGPRPARKRKKP